MDVLIIGAGNHAKVVIDILEENREHNIIGLLDDNEGIHGEYLLDKEILGSIEKLKEFSPLETRFIISIGDNKVRHKLYDKLLRMNFSPINVISKHAIISQFAKLGNGLIINAGANIHPDALIQNNIIIGMNATISHDVVIEDSVHISPGVHLTGSVHVENNVDIGTGAVVIPGVKIGRNSIIGAGAVVTKNVKENAVAVGVPAKTIKNLR